MMMLILSNTKQYLKLNLAMKKLTDTEAGLKKFFAYKKNVHLDSAQNFCTCQ